MACVEFEDSVATLCMESARLPWEKGAGELGSEAVSRRLAVMGIYKKTIQTPRPPNITRFACAHIQYYCLRIRPVPSSHRDYPPSKTHSGLSRALDQDEK